MAGATAPALLLSGRRRPLDKTKGLLRFQLHLVKLNFNLLKLRYLMPSARWLDYLSDEDLSFVKRLVLASGSLKEVAAGYGISYPTVRLRLDRLIAKIRITDNADIHSEFERVLRAQHAEGRIDAETLKTLLAGYQKDLERTRRDTRTA